MATLVGDVIQQFRDLSQDPPQGLAAPTFNGTPAATAGGFLPNGTYFFVVTAINQWGESLPSNELSVTISGSNNTITGAIFGPFGNTNQFRIYLSQPGGGAGNEVSYMAFTGGTFVISNNFQLSAGSPPVTNSAYNPDTDGSYMRAAPVFRWLNDALRQSSRIVGGLTDYSGFPSTINFATYTITGEWTKMLNAWYDGYPVAFAPTSSFFKRNTVTSSILAGWSVAFYNNQLGVELWPQPARTAAQTTLASPMGPADTTATLTTTAGFLLPVYGMVQIDTEICAYNGINGNQLIGLIRGLGGTVPAIHLAGVTTNELNAFFQGRRVFNTQYTPGQSTLNLPIPAGWDGILIHFLMSKFLETERDFQGAAAKMKDFKSSLTEYMRMNRQIAGPKQAGDRDFQFVVFGGTQFGGNVIP